MTQTAVLDGLSILNHSILSGVEVWWGPQCKPQHIALCINIKPLRDHVLYIYDKIFLLKIN